MVMRINSVVMSGCPAGFLWSIKVRIRGIDTNRDPAGTPGYLRSADKSSGICIYRCKKYRTLGKKFLAQIL